MKDKYYVNKENPEDVVRLLEITDKNSVFIEFKPDKKVQGGCITKYGKEKFLEIFEECSGEGYEYPETLEKIYLDEFEQNRKNYEERFDEYTYEKYVDSRRQEVLEMSDEEFEKMCEEYNERK